MAILFGMHLRKTGLKHGAIIGTGRFADPSTPIVDLIAVVARHADRVGLEPNELGVISTTTIMYDDFNTFYRIAT